MLLENRGAGHDAFRLEPKQKSHAGLVRGVGDGLQTVRESGRISAQVADRPRPTVGTAGTLVPAGIDPPRVDRNVMGGNVVNRCDHILFGRPLKRHDTVRGGLHGGSTGFWPVVCV